MNNTNSFEEIRFYTGDKEIIYKIKKEKLDGSDNKNDN
tara:strand:- start:1791 stop:1904 length:114 start_codon:yes stop_codon:yes gene_type:complete